MKTSNVWLLVIILALFGFSLWAVTPLDSDRLGRKGLTLGLDLKGGAYLVYEADLSKRDTSQTIDQTMSSVLSKIERRANAFGVKEPIIQRQGENRILVQLPGEKNVDEAKKLIGQVALLEFKEVTLDTSGQPMMNEDNTDYDWKTAMATGTDGSEKELTGKYLKPNSQVVLKQDTNEPQVAFEWNEEGAVLFEQVTKRNLQKPLGIFLDNQLISAPTVQAVIKSNGVITGVELDEAKNLSIQLNSGSLDVPLTVIQEQTVDATLGADSLRKSVVAGAIGLILVVLFMLLYYRMSGLIATLALIIYGIFLMAIFKLVPVTLTLSGIAAAVVSIGMAVDANILIFERMKEELRAGRTLGAAVDAGFNRAWLAIRDSNVTTFIACIVLYWFGDTFGAFMVKGFALTLFIGVALSMFTAITVSRVFLSMIVRVVKNHWLYGVK
ncbi:MAG: protein translocase subunit SecD [Dehalococcoidia bacterium]|nr:protein translocase subunit SecD [Dehalococcoidia bacterium]